MITGQTLHGYEDGHVLITGSFDPDEASASLMLLMSDLAPSERISAKGWLTAYPLPSMDAYVLARTWPAPEMPRPGCVWTHSLILDYATLGSMTSMEPLLDAFRRPSHADLHAYVKPLELNVERAPVRLDHSFYPAARVALSRLYGETGQVVLPCQGLDPERLAMALWAQQWPRLRRRSRWVSLPVSPSSALPEFDFMMNADKSCRSTAGDKSLRQGWIVGALSDLRTGGGAVRDRLRAYAIDVGNGRKAFSWLIVAAVLSGSSKPKPREIGRYLALMHARLPKEGAVAKADLLGAYLKSTVVVDAALLEVALSLLPDLPLDDQGIVEIAAACWRLDPEKFWNTFGERDPSIVEQVLQRATLAELREALVAYPKRVEEIFTAKPDLVIDPQTWSLSSQVRAAALSKAREVRKARKAAFKAAFVTQDLDAGRYLAQADGAGAMLDTICDVRRSRKASPILSPFERDWIGVAAEDLHGVFEHLNSSAGDNRVFIFLARQLGPMTFEPSGKTEDPWFKAWNASKGAFEPSDNEFIATFFLMRACSFEMHDRASIFGVAANAVIDAMERGMSDMQAIRAVSDLSIPNIFNLFESRYRALMRGLATWSAIQSVPIIGFVSSGRAKYVEDFLSELKWVRGGQDVVELALRSGRDLPKRRRQMLESVRF